MSESSGSGSAAADGQVVLVTGASRGVGRATALRFARAGAAVALAGRDVEALAETARAVEEAGAEALVLAFDVSDADACRDAVRRTAESLGAVTTLVNNAGIAESATFLDTTLTDWRRTMAVDVEAPFVLTQAVLPAMLQAGAGAVVNIASIAAKRGFPYVAAYTAAKHALLGLTRSLATEFATSGVTFNCVCPYYIDTDMVRQTIDAIVARGRTEAEATARLANPQGGLVDPEDVASLCLFLASPAARSITGQAYNIDGGLHQG
ncbi:SDR family NAD(P)-dependent oxidoreductase [Nocardioides humi]|uniref:SDR family NAD(P)-dependent oxidoreductase n=1 Tax=Nocardioides humi TaxID=449461 RepID=A0ABN2BYS0_9ACTN|nr:SDR family NAD(P)-dependent oxidoreductase [Nocardioides humi]